MGILDRHSELFIVDLNEVYQYLTTELRRNIDSRLFAVTINKVDFFKVIDNLVEVVFHGGPLGHIVMELEKTGIDNFKAMEVTSEAYNLTAHAVGIANRELTLGYEDHITFRLDEIYDLYITRIKTE